MSDFKIFRLCTCVPRFVFSAFVRSCSGNLSKQDIARQVNNRNETDDALAGHNSGSDHQGLSPSPESEKERNCRQNHPDQINDADGVYLKRIPWSSLHAVIPCPKHKNYSAHISNTAPITRGTRICSNSLLFFIIICQPPGNKRGESRFLNE